VAENVFWLSFFYDKLIVSNSHVWIRKTNILEPKKIWVPKSTSLSNDIGTHQDVESGGTLIVVGHGT